MTTFREFHSEDNIARLNAFLDQFPADIDPDFDDATEELDRQLAEFRLGFANH